MTRLRVMLARLLGTLSGRRREDELREELETHLELLADEHRRRGLSDAQARLAARRELGGVAQTREAFRDTRVLPGIDALRQDIRFAWRALLRDRGTTFAAIALLTVGVSSTVVLVDVVDRLLLRPPTTSTMPCECGRSIAATNRAEDGRASLLTSNYVTMERLAAGIRGEIDALATYQHERIGSGRGLDADRFVAIDFSEAYFDVLGIRPSLGVFPTARHASDPGAVVISHALWQQRFSSAADVIGRPLRLGQRTHTIVAVGPRGFAGIDDDPVDVWVPLEAASASRTGGRARITSACGRSCASSPASIARAWRLTRPRCSTSRSASTGRPARQGCPPHVRAPAARPVPSSSTHTQVLLAVSAVAGLVLLMACGNVANLLILTGLRRTAELSLKAALGAGRGRLLREVFLQAVILAALAGVAALGLVVTRRHSRSPGVPAADRRDDRPDGRAG